HPARDRRGSSRDPCRSRRGTRTARGAPRASASRRDRDDRPGPGPTPSATPRWRLAALARATWRRPCSVEWLRRARDVVVDRTAAREAGLEPVPEADRLFAEAPAQQDVLAAAARREVDQALLDVLHFAAQRADLLDLVGQRLVEAAEQRLRAPHVGG